MIGKTQELKYNLLRTSTATNRSHSSEARKKQKASKKKIKNVKATRSTTEEKVAEHHRICLLRSFPAKRSKTSSPAELLRKGLVNNIKPYVVYLFIHFLKFFFTSTHTVTSFLLDLSSVFQMGTNWRCESEPYAPVSRGR